MLTIIWVHFLGVSFEVEERLKLTQSTISCLKPVRIMLETWQLLRMYIHICDFSTKAFLILLMLVFFFFQNISFFGKNSTFTQSDRVLSCEIFFSFVFSFCCKIKGYC